MNVYHIIFIYLLLLAIGGYAMADKPFDPYCWEPNFTIHYMCNGGWCYK